MFKLAWRNVWRNRRRSVITLASMGCGLAAILFAQSLIKTVQYSLIEKATGVITGHLRVEDAASEDFKFPDKTIVKTAEVDRILSSRPEISAFERRIMITGLVSSKKDSVGALVCGVDPAKDAQATTMHGYLTQGSFLTGKPAEIVMGDTLAHNLGVGLGAKVVVMAQASDGSMGAENLKIAGLFHTGSESFDASIVYISLPALQEMLVMEGRVNDFIVRLKDPSQLEESRAAIARALAGLHVGVHTWRETDHELVGMQRYQNAILTTMLIIVFAIVAMGILNTLLMSMFERVREFGVLMALGARPAWVLRLIILESLILGALGIAVGVTLGSALIIHYGHVGLHLPLKEAFEYFIPFDPLLFMRFNWSTHRIAIFAVLATCVLSAAFPAYKASKLKAAEAMRHI